MRKTPILFCFLGFLLNSSAQKQSRLVHITTAMYEYNDSSKVKTLIDYAPLNRSFRIWYNDSLVISECYIHKHEETDDSTSKSWVEIDRYIFNDLRKKSYYEYSSMTDTATLLQVYACPSKRPYFRNGFISLNLNQETMDSTWFEGAVPIADTVIENTVYSRYALRKKERKQELFSIIYFDCSQNNSLIAWQKMPSEKKGCQIVRTDTKSSLNPFKRTIIEVKQVYEALTTQELKVFNSWKRYAKANPVTKSIVYETPVEEEVTVYQTCLRDRLFDGTYEGPNPRQFAETITYKLTDTSFRVLKRYNKTTEAGYSLYIVRDSTASDNIGWHSYIISKEPKISLEQLALLSTDDFDVYLYEGGKFISGDCMSSINGCKLVAYYNNKKYEWGASCLRIMPAYDPYPKPKPAPECLDWFWAGKDEKGNVLSKRFLFKSCDIISWPKDSGHAEKPIDN